MAQTLAQLAPTNSSQQNLPIPAPNLVETRANENSHSGLINTPVPSDTIDQKKRCSSLWPTPIRQPALDLSDSQITVQEPVKTLELIYYNQLIPLLRNFYNSIPRLAFAPIQPISPSSQRTEPINILYTTRANSPIALVSLLWAQVNHLCNISHSLSHFAPASPRMLASQKKSTMVF